MSSNALSELKTIKELEQTPEVFREYFKNALELRKAICDLTDLMTATLTAILTDCEGGQKVPIDLVKAYAWQSIADAVIFAIKQADYGSGNIAKAGEVGCLLRSSDKIERLFNLRGQKAKNEPVMDSWADLSNYGIIARMVRSGQWPDVRPGWSI